MPIHDINLTGHFDRFIQDQVESGRYQDASEVLRAGLRLLEQQHRAEQEQLSLLKNLANEGFQSLDQGDGIAFCDSDELAAAISQLGQQAAANRSS